MAMNKRISVSLNDEEERFVKWMAKRDEVSVNDELWFIFNTELSQLRMLYEDEMKMEEGE